MYNITVTNNGHFPFTIIIKILLQDEESPASTTCTEGFSSPWTVPLPDFPRIQEFKYSCKGWQNFICQNQYTFKSKSRAIPVHVALWETKEKNSLSDGVRCQIGLVLGDPPGVWELRRGISRQESRVFTGLDLIWYNE